MIHTRRSDSRRVGRVGRRDRGAVARFLGQEGIVRIGLADRVDDQLLGERVDLGHNVVLGLVDDALEPLVALHLQPAGAARGLDGHSQLIVETGRALSLSKIHDLGHGAIVGWPTMHHPLRRPARNWPMTSKTWTLVAAVLGSSIVFLDSAVLTVALPAIGREPRLFVDVLEGQNYIQYGYLLTLSSLLVLAGALSDFYGRRRMFVIGLVGFGITSLLCGLAPNVETLIVLRLVQGGAGALLVPGSLAILTNNFEGEEQGRAFGIWAAASGLAPILGPFVGGVLVDNFSWRWIFLLNVPFTAVAVWAAVRHVKESRDRALRRQLRLDRRRCSWPLPWAACRSAASMASNVSGRTRSPLPRLAWAP